MQDLIFPILGLIFILFSLTLLIFSYFLYDGYRSSKERATQLKKKISNQDREKDVYSLRGIEGSDLQEIFVWLNKRNCAYFVSHSLVLYQLGSFKFYLEDPKLMVEIYKEEIGQVIEFRRK
jgi:hypothetical protein